MENYEASKSNVWDFCFKISPRSVKVDKGKRGHLYKQISKNTFWNFLIYLLTILSLPLVPIHNTLSFYHGQRQVTQHACSSQPDILPDKCYLLEAGRYQELEFLVISSDIWT